MVNFRGLLALLVLLAASMTPVSHAQSTAVAVLELDGESVLENELLLAQKAVGSALKRGVLTVKRDGRGVAARLMAGTTPADAVSRLREALDGYAVGLRADGTIHAELTDATLARRLLAAGETAEAVARQRLAAGGLDGATVERRNVTQLVLSAPAGGSAQFEDVVRLVQQQGLLSVHRVVEAEDVTNMKIGAPSGGRVALADPHGDVIVMFTSSMLDNSAFAAARAEADIHGGHAIGFELTEQAAAIFADATATMIGARFAIVLDGRVLTAPEVRQRIEGGKGQITGAFTQQEAAEIAAILNTKPMPAKLRLVEVRTQ